MEQDNSITPKFEGTGYSTSLSELTEYLETFYLKLYTLCRDIDNLIEQPLIKLEVIALFCKLGEIMTYFRDFKRGAKNSIQSQIYDLLNSFIAENTNKEEEGNITKSDPLLMFSTYRNEFYHKYPYYEEEKKEITYNTRVHWFLKKTTELSTLIHLLNEYEKQNNFQEEIAENQDEISEEAPEKSEKKNQLEQQHSHRFEKKTPEGEALLAKFNMVNKEIKTLTSWSVELLNKYKLATLYCYHNIVKAITEINLWWNKKGKGQLPGILPIFYDEENIEEAVFYKDLTKKRNALAHDMYDNLPVSEFIDSIAMLVSMRNKLLNPLASAVFEDERERLLQATPKDSREYEEMLAARKEAIEKLNNIQNFPAEELKINQALYDKINSLYQRWTNLNQNYISDDFVLEKDADEQSQQVLKAQQLYNAVNYMIHSVPTDAHERKEMERLHGEADETWKKIWDQPEENLKLNQALYDAIIPLYYQWYESVKKPSIDSSANPDDTITVGELEKKGTTGSGKRLLSPSPDESNKKQKTTDLGGGSIDSFNQGPPQTPTLFGSPGHRDFPRENENLKKDDKTEGKEADTSGEEKGPRSPTY